MPIELWASFVVASAALLVIPGPTILTVISYSMAHGRQSKIVLVAAVALGDATALAFSLLGLGAVLGHVDILVYRNQVGRWSVSSVHGDKPASRKPIIAGAHRAGVIGVSLEGFCQYLPGHGTQS